MIRFGRLVVSLSLLAGVVAAQAQNAPPRILVKYKSYNPAAMAPVEDGLGTAPAGYIPNAQTMVYSVGGFMSADQTLAYYRSMPNVAWAEYDFKVKAVADVNDTYVSQQWDFAKVNMPAVQGRNFAEVPVAIVDTGADSTHPDLNGKVLKGWNFLTNTDAYADDNGHGTHVAGTIAACTNNGLGVAGFSYNSKLLIAKVLGSDGSGTVSGVASGIRWAADNGAKVVNLSLGSPTDSNALQEAITYATNKGALVVAAAGNSGVTTKFYPAGDVGVLSVGASSRDDSRASFSNYGSWVRVAAPGDGILSTLPGNKYGVYSGTSMASPHVAAMAALVFGQKGLSTKPADVQAAIEAGCDPVGSWVAKGRINAQKMLDGSVAPPPPVITGVVTNAASYKRGDALSATFSFSAKAPADMQFSYQVKGPSAAGPVLKYTLPKGSDSAKISYTIGKDAALGNWTVCGTLGDKTVSANYQVADSAPALDLKAVSASATSVKQGGSLVFTVGFNQKAAADTQFCWQLKNGSAAGSQVKVTLPKGSDSARVEVKVGTDAKVGAWTFCAQLGTKTLSANYTVNPADVPFELKSLAMSSSSAKRGGSVFATLSFSSKAPAGKQISVQLKFGTKAGSPVNLTVPTGADSVRIEVKVGADAAYGTWTFCSTCGSTTKSATYQVVK